MISEHGLATLRLAGALSHAMPRVGLTVSHGDRAVLDVGDPQVGTAPRRASPCGFRMAVARALRLHRSGARQRFLDLPADTDPTVTMVVDGRPRPGGVVRSVVGDRVVWATTTTLDPSACRAVGGERLAHPLLAGEVALRWDPALEVTVVSREEHPSLSRAIDSAVSDALQGLLARYAVAELLEAPSVGARSH